MKILFGFGLFIISAVVSASKQQGEVTVYGRKVDLVGQATSASQGLVSQEELNVRPILRTGEILESIPGMVVTQHSGTGKANQYFLRGFNLDHGTDFATEFDHMPLNMRTHGHGQGYTDLNFIIPELVQQIDYKKGPYYAEQGDFSSAGGAHMHSFSQLEQGLLKVAVGDGKYSRVLTMDSIKAGTGELLYALEANRYHGPWRDIDEDLDKINSTFKYSQNIQDTQVSMMLMTYNNSWNSADQIPYRAVESGLIDELGSLDASLGGESSRYSLSLNVQAKQWQASAYVVSYDMNLWSNFTYFLDDPVNGDQFEQVDKRWIYGGDVSYNFDSILAGRVVKNTLGMDVRIDDIDEVGLYSSRKRQRMGTVRSDRVEERSVGLFAQSEFRFNDKLRATLGARYDYYNFDVNSLLGVNSHGVDLSNNDGGADDGLLTAKASVSYALSQNWEAYGSVGTGFHSNDARGTTIKVDPSSGDSVNAVDPLVKSNGAELGLRSFFGKQLNASIALWHLNLDSELLFVGDAGNTEPSRESDRKGVEFTAYYRINNTWTVDMEYAYSEAEFTKAEIDGLPLGVEVPGNLDTVASVGLLGQFSSGWFGNMRLRHFGTRPLDETGKILSGSSTTLNFRGGYQWQKLQLTVDVLNLLDSDDHDISYFYESRLTAEATAREDLHYHVMEPRTVRAYVSYYF